LKLNFINGENFKSAYDTVSFKNTSSYKQSISFIVINIFVAFLGFVRSFAFMKFLDFKELGLITLIQTGAMLIGFFQIGLINGGYRILALQKSELSEETNNVIFSYISLLSVFLIIIFIIGSAFGLFPEKLIISLSVITGLFLLINNWLSNTLIAERAYARINKANSISALISLACLPLAFYWGIYGGAVCILAQPLFFSLIVLLSGVKERPTKFVFKISKIRNILHYGFIPFLSGLFFLLYVQIERWSIASFLGTTALGHLYLVFLMSTLWILIPTSISNLLYPRAVMFYEKKDLSGFKNIIVIHALFILAYSLLITLLIFFLLKPLVTFIFPQHSPYIKFAIYALPGLFFRSLADPISIVLNSIVKLKPLFWSDIYGLALYTTLIALLATYHIFSLTTVLISFNLYFAFKFIFLAVTLLKLRSQFMPKYFNFLK
jgi:O-antigen/teichoic acid export membrane protein